jgi:hypothetical protein
VKPSQIFSKWFPVVRRALKEATIPAIGGTVWAIWAYSQGKSAFEIATAFGFLFFIVLYFQGQFLRVARDVRAEEQASEWRDSFASIQRRLDALTPQEQQELQDLSQEDFDRVRMLNDEFRTTRRNVDDDILWPMSLARRERAFRESVLKAIREQRDFSHDLVGLHDHGTVVVEGMPVQWSIEYRSGDGRITYPHLATRRAITIERN